MNIPPGLKFTRTRLAPTPSGFLHLGNIFSFAITAGLAQQTGARILLRIDDMDHQRTDRMYVEDIFDTLSFLGIPWHEGPRNLDSLEREYSQIRRMDIYEAALRKLEQSGLIFACTCSRSEIRRLRADATYTGTCRHKNLPLDTKDACWRLNTDGVGKLTVSTLNGPVQVAFPESVQYFVVRKRDGSPAYQLSSLADDVHFGVDLIVRGEDLFDSTLAQLHLAGVLHEPSFSNATFHHHRLLLESGEKLSKSAGATSVQYLREQGKTAEEIFTLIQAMTGTQSPVKTWQELVAANIA